MGCAANKFGVLTKALLLLDDRFRAHSTSPVARYKFPLWCYARATQSPVLKQAMRLRRNVRLRGYYAMSGTELMVCMFSPERAYGVQCPVLN
eukprot:3294749-Rhodomonas_salina.2